MTGQEADPNGEATAVLADLITPMAVRTAATLRIPDHLHHRSASAQELAPVIAVKADALDGLLRHLVSIEVCALVTPGRYTLGPGGHALTSDHPSGLLALLDGESALGRGDLAFVHLLDAVRTGSAAFPLLFGRSFWQDCAADPARRATYDAQMSHDVAAWAPEIIRATDWGAFDHIVDVGGGDGTLLAAILNAFPSPRGTLFDQAHTSASARTRIQTLGLNDRVECVSGTFFDSLPSGADAYVLCAILHDWNDVEACRILRNCAEAARPHGTVFVIEKTGADGESPSSAMDLRMLVYFGGRQRGVADLLRLAAQSDLNLIAVHRSGELSLLELAPQGGGSATRGAPVPARS